MKQMTLTIALSLLFLGVPAEVRAGDGLRIDVSIPAISDHDYDRRNTGFHHQGYQNKHFRHAYWPYYTKRHPVFFHHPGLHNGHYKIDKRRKFHHGAHYYDRRYKRPMSYQFSYEIR